MIQKAMSRNRAVAAVAALALAAVVGLGLAGCSGSGSGSGAASGSNATTAPAATASADRPVVKISCISREEPEINWLSEQLTDKYDIQAVVFSDNPSVNESLVSGDVDANYFQNTSYLEGTYNLANGTDLQPYGEGIFWMPYVIMSKDFDSLDEIADGSTILVAQAASSLNNELHVLEQAGLIKLNPDATTATQFDVIENPHNLEFVLVDARSRTGAYDDANLMIAPTYNVVMMNRDDVKLSDALYTQSEESHDSYVDDTVIVVRKDTKDENPQWLQDIDAAWHSAEFKAWLLDTFEGAKVPAF